MQTTTNIILGSECLPLVFGKHIEYDTKSISLFKLGKKLKTVKKPIIEKVVVVYFELLCFIVVVSQNNGKVVVTVYDDNLTYRMSRNHGFYDRSVMFTRHEDVLFYHVAENRFSEIYGINFRRNVIESMMFYNLSTTGIKIIRRYNQPNNKMPYVIQTFSSLNKENYYTIGKFGYVHRGSEVTCWDDRDHINFTKSGFKNMHGYEFYDKLIFTSNAYEAVPANILSHQLILGKLLVKHYVIKVVNSQLDIEAMIYVSRPYFPSVFLRICVLREGVFAIIAEYPDTFSVYLCGRQNNYLPLLFNTYKTQYKLINFGKNLLTIQTTDKTFIYKNTLDFVSYLHNTFRAVLKLSAIDLPRDMIGEINAYF